MTAAAAVAGTASRAGSAPRMEGMLRDAMIGDARARATLGGHRVHVTLGGLSPACDSAVIGHAG